MPKISRRQRKQARRFAPYPDTMPRTRAMRLYDEEVAADYADFYDRPSLGWMPSGAPAPRFVPHNTPMMQFHYGPPSVNTSIQWDSRTPHFGYQREGEYELVLVQRRRTSMVPCAVGLNSQEVGIAPSHAPTGQLAHLSLPTVPHPVESNGRFDIVPSSVGTSTALPYPLSGVGIAPSIDKVYCLGSTFEGQAPQLYTLQKVGGVENSIPGPPDAVAKTPVDCDRKLPSVDAPAEGSRSLASEELLPEPSFTKPPVETIPRRSPRSISKPPAGSLTMTNSHGSSYWGGVDVVPDIFLKAHSFPASSSGEVFHEIDGLILPDIRSVPLVVEIPRGMKKIAESVIADKSKTHDRWKRCETIYVIMPSMYQVGVAKSLAVPHGQFPLSELIPSLREFSTDPLSSRLTVHFIGSASNYSDANITIRNDVGRSDLPWKQIAAGVSTTTSSDSNSPSRQRLYIDYGYAGTQCVGRSGQCDLGLSAPRKLVTSRESKQSEDFFSRTRQIDSLVEGAEALNGFNVPRERVKRWGASLGHGNEKEAARLHQTLWSPEESSICAFHTDGQNGKISPVTFCNRVYVGEGGTWIRQGAVTYFRKSIDDYESRRKIHGPYLTRIKETLEDGLEGRMEQTSATLRSRELFEIAEGLNVARIPCNCEVESYYQPFVACCVRLSSAFELDELQLTSVAMAMAQSACSAAFALAATEIAIARKDMVTSDVGWTLLDIIRFIDHSDPKPIKVPYRFAKYAMFGEESERRWLKHVCVSLLAMRNVRAKTTSLTQSDYNTVQRTISSELPGVGKLRSNHVVGIMSLLGLVPLKLFGMINGGAAKAYARLANDFPENVPGSQEECFDHIQHLLEAMLGRRVSKRYTENVFCKVGRRWAGSDKRFHDIVDVRFPLMVVRGSRVALLDRDGGVDRLVPSIFDVNNRVVRSNVPCKYKSKFRCWMSTKKTKGQRKSTLRK